MGTAGGGRARRAAYATAGAGCRAGRSLGAGVVGRGARRSCTRRSSTCGSTAPRGVPSSTVPTSTGRCPASTSVNTYPPFAALLFVPAALAPLRVREGRVASSSTSACSCVVVLAVDAALAGAAPRSPPSAGLVAVAIWSEPVMTSLLVRADQPRAARAGALGRRPCRRSSRLRGVGIGLAAAIKVTPGLLIVYLVLTRPLPGRGHRGRDRPGHHRRSMLLVDAASAWDLLDAPALRLQPDRPARERRQPVGPWLAGPGSSTRRRHPCRSRCCSSSPCSSPGWRSPCSPTAASASRGGCSSTAVTGLIVVAHLVEPPLGLVRADPAPCSGARPARGWCRRSSSSGRTSCGWCRTATPSSSTSAPSRSPWSGAYAVFALGFLALAVVRARDPDLRGTP